MKAVTLHQPHASAVEIGLKPIETRGWRTHYRGPLAIHASQSANPAYIAMLRAALPADQAAFVDAGYGIGGKPSLIKLPQSSIIAIVDLIDCVPVEEIEARYPVLFVKAPTVRYWGDYRPGRFCWVLNNIRRLATPIKARGNQGLWDWTPPADLVFADSAPASGSPAARLPVLPAYRLPAHIKRPPFAAA